MRESKFKFSSIYEGTVQYIDVVSTQGIRVAIPTIQKNHSGYFISFHKTKLVRILYHSITIPSSMDLGTNRLCADVPLNTVQANHWFVEYIATVYHRPI